ncbi:MAG TPA: DNA-3-methyladenine glycosylase I [Thermoanaerobaculia bacterium]|nr:DNA-3-methyladenine glycosylase I [Thermoanaerobaculia bacterium]
MAGQGDGGGTGGRKALRRCPWAGSDPLYLAYHDRQWGVPVHDDRELFEMLLLEGAQAGLSWLTILRRREEYRRVFAEFDPHRLARWGERQIAAALADPGIVRNRLKVAAAVRNARAFVALSEERGSFDAFLWERFGGMPRQNRRRTMAEMPAETVESQSLSRELRARGFTFVGPTICYAFMQAVGVVNDHLVSCFRHAELGGGGRKRAPTRTSRITA